MKKILYWGIILFIGTGCVCNKKFYSNKREYMGHALLIPKHIWVPIYNTCRKDVIGYAINDTIKESYVLITITDIRDSLAKIMIDYPLENNKRQKGWIELKYLGIHLSHYSDTLCVMSYPNSSEVAFKITRPQWRDFYPIIDAKQGWLYIQNIYNLKEFGWLAPELQCQNPYTSCN